ncbi:MAG: hypothetical protein ABI386_09160 [Rhodanobacter sp.]
MRWNRSSLDAWQGSARRVASLVLVIGIHLGMWLLFFGGVVRPWSLPQTGIDARMNRLDIRLIPAPAKLPVHEPSAATPLPPARPRVRFTPSPSPAPRVTQSSVTPAPYVAATPPLATSGDYIPGGNLRRGTNPNFPPASHLPGSSVPVVEGFHLVDPRTQGVAGVARALQGLFGVTSAHCIDVEVWRNMTRQERLARHISLEQVEHTARENHCGPG